MLFTGTTFKFIRDLSGFNDWSTSSNVQRYTLSASIDGYRTVYWGSTEPPNTIHTHTHINIVKITNSSHKGENSMNVIHLQTLLYTVLYKFGIGGEELPRREQSQSPRL